MLGVGGLLWMVGGMWGGVPGSKLAMMGDATPLPPPGKAINLSPLAWDRSPARRGSGRGLCTCCDAFLSSLNRERILRVSHGVFGRQRHPLVREEREMSVIRPLLVLLLVDLFRGD